MSTPKAASRSGILAGGNWLVDQVKTIDCYPQPEQLAAILQQQQGTGGGPYNLLINLARSGARFPLLAAGMIGRDAFGGRIRADLRRHRIDSRYLKMHPSAATAFSDVMTECQSGRRTFFYASGANALWDGADLDFGKSKARVFYLGYLLLLDALDAPEATYGTKAARLLAMAQAAGLKTCIDVVSEDSNRYRQLVLPALRFTDYCVLNEFEAGRASGYSPRQSDGTVDPVGLRHAAGALLQHGVRELVAIHFPEGAFVRTHDGNDFWQPSVKLPAHRIVGAAGAGDAFCAGLLFGLHQGWHLPRCLRTGVCLAAASLSSATCTAGVGSLASSLALARKYGFGTALNSAR